MLRHLLDLAMHYGVIVHAGRHLWVTTFDGEGWLSSYDAILNMARQACR